VVNRTHDGAPLAGKIRSAWDGILEDAGLGEDVVRHSLRHTAATWLMQRGTDRWEAAGWLGMTLEQLENGYGHHHPDFQEEAAGAFGQRQA
jgi:integrase